MEINEKTIKSLENIKDSDILFDILKNRTKENLFKKGIVFSEKEKQDIIVNVETEKIVEAIQNIQKTEVNIPEFPEIKDVDMSETNKILKDIAKAINEDITIELVIK